MPSISISILEYVRIHLCPTPLHSLYFECAQREFYHLMQFTETCSAESQLTPT